MQRMLTRANRVKAMNRVGQTLEPIILGDNRLYLYSGEVSLNPDRTFADFTIVTQGGLGYKACPAFTLVLETEGIIVMAPPASIYFKVIGAIPDPVIVTGYIVTNENATPVLQMMARFDNPVLFNATDDGIFVQPMIGWGE